MSKISSDDLAHVAKLAKLNLTSDEIKNFTPQIEKIIDFVSQLKEVDTEGIDPTSQTTGLTNVFRDDVATTDNVLQNSEATSGSDNVYNGYFKVPQILTERSDK